MWAVGDWDGAEQRAPFCIAQSGATQGALAEGQPRELRIPSDFLPLSARLKQKHERGAQLCVWLEDFLETLPGTS